MRVFRTSGLPIEPHHQQNYEKELREGFDEIEKRIGEFAKLSSKDQSRFQKELEQLDVDLKEKYPTTAEWDLEHFQSMQKLKKVINRYGVVAFGKDEDTKKPAIFIIDSKF